MKREGRVLAIIPVRKGSVRVKNKSVRRFHDSNLLEIKIKSLLNVPEIDSIVVNTDSDEAIDIAKDYKIDYHKRSDYYASTECSNADFFKHIAENASDNYSYLLYVPVTSPLVQSESISNVIKLFMNADKYDSVATVNIIKQPLWLDDKPLNFKLGCAPKSQELPDVYAINFAAMIISKTDQIKYKNVIGLSPKFYELNEYESRDIDTMFDFHISEFLYKSKMV